MAQHQLSYRSYHHEYDRATVLGLACAFGLVFSAILLGGSFPIFLDFKSVLIVVGGTIGATLVNFPMGEVVRAFDNLRTAVRADTSSPHARLRKIISLAERSRTEGVLILESEIFRELDPFLRKSVELVVDGLPPDEIRRLMELELSVLATRSKRGVNLFQTMGTIAPAMGLIGTLIGLIQMLGNVDDPKKLGGAMAVALVTTFYGAILANLLFLPIAGKLRARAEEDLLVKEMTIEGMILIAQGANPRLIEESLLAFIPVEHRITRFS